MRKRVHATLFLSWLIAFAFFPPASVGGGEEPKGISPERYDRFMKSLNIVKPDNTVPEGLARFSGIWLGTFRKESLEAGERAAWWHVMDHVLVVEKIRPPRAVVIDGFQMPGIGGRPNELYRVRLDGEFADGALTVAYGIAGDYVHISTYRMQGDGNLRGVRADASGTYRATFVKWRPK